MLATVGARSPLAPRSGDSGWSPPCARRAHARQRGGACCTIAPDKSKAIVGRDRLKWRRANGRLFLICVTIPQLRGERNALRGASRSQKANSGEARPTTNRLREAFNGFLAGVVSAFPEIQRKRALDRPGMTEEKLAALLAQQIPDVEKRRRADFVVDSSQGFDHTRAQIRDIV